MENNIKVIAFVQARAESLRLPNKIFKKIKKNNVIELVIKRLKKSKEISKIVILSSKSKANLKIKKIANNLGCEIFYGDKDDVLNRFYFASKRYQDYKNIVRITADCPLIDSNIVDKIIKRYLSSNCDYCSNVLKPSFPDGFDVEIFKKSALEKAWKLDKNKNSREHVTSYIINNKNFIKVNYSAKENLSNYKLSLDTEEDLNNLKKLFNYFNDIYFPFSKIEKLLKKKEFDKMKNIRNLGMQISKGQKIWQKAKGIISNGNMFFSKNPDNILPNIWPSYYTKAKGCQIWDLDNKKYFDLSFMGVGTNILGYANNKIDQKVKSAIDNSNMSTFNCYEEVQFSEKLLSICPWADRVKLARTGGELNSMAIRIARAATGKDKIAICGYHGWHDWYLAANIKNKKNLNNHLFSNLYPSGVPKKLKDTVFTFEYNNIIELEKIISNHKIAAIKMEVMRNILPKNNFLKKVREIADKNKVVLIFDECTTGFRETFGGLYTKFNVKPDIVLFGKALGNGYPISAMVGKSEILDYAKKTFISSTFWSDRIGPTAGLATLNEMERIKSWKIISNIGKKIKNNLTKLSDDNKLDISIHGLDALPNYFFNKRNNKIYKFFITQEMLKKNFLAGLSIYCCIDHNNKILQRYFENLNDVFNLIKKNNTDKKILKLLDHKVSYFLK